MPRHFVVFSPAGLRGCVERAGLGLQSLSTETRLAQMIYHHSSYAKAGDLGVAERINFKTSTKVAARLFRIIENLLVYLNRGRRRGNFLRLRRSEQIMTAGPEKRNTCAVVVTFHPDAHLLHRMERVSEQAGQTVIVDNGSPVSCVAQIREIADKLAIHLILNASNKGTACALNEGVRWAASQGYQWVLTLDQDTAVGPGLVDSMGETFRACHFADRLAVIGSNYRDKVTGRVLSQVIGSKSSSDGEITTALTSGSLISVDAFEVIGGFRDEFFIDCVDHVFPPCSCSRFSCGYDLQTGNGTWDRTHDRASVAMENDRHFEPLSCASILHDSKYFDYGPGVHRERTLVGPQVSVVVVEVNLAGVLIRRGAHRENEADCPRLC